MSRNVSSHRQGIHSSPENNSNSPSHSGRIHFGFVSFFSSRAFGRFQKYTHTGLAVNFVRRGAFHFLESMELGLGGGLYTHVHSLQTYSKLSVKCLATLTFIVRKYVCMCCFVRYSERPEQGLNLRRGGHGLDRRNTDRTLQLTASASSHTDVTA